MESPRIGELESQYLGEVLGNNFRNSTNGFMVTRFEEAFAELVVAKHAIAMCNGTATLHTALHVMGVEPGDIVFTGTSGVTARLQPGDVLVPAIDGLGELRNVVA